ncbi:MAG: cardiolipin synthase [Bacteroides sp.]|nr:cardiolipin synthase [Bacteroides sp.]MBD5347691.1 cardiolipin synthase [Bacteroides sp.]
MHSLFVWSNIIVLIFYIITIISCIVVVLKENRNPIRSLAWVIALIFLPVVGLVFYIFFGRSLRGQHMISRMNKRRIITTMAPRHVNLNSLNLSRAERNLVKLARNISSSFYTINNKIEIFTNGEDKFTALKKDLEEARHSIFLQYYIFLDDTLGHEIAEILMKKARQGLDVKVIYDHVGSFSARNKFFKMMNSAGVETHPFFRVTFPQFANRVNWRNHRKLVIIDEKIGYIGGMNIADRYVNRQSHGWGWRDTHFRLEGDITESLLYSFVVDWNFRNQEHPMYYPRKAVETQIRNQLGMQLVTSGPLAQWNNLSLCFLKAITAATKCIYIQTPYFLPTDALRNALEAAALSKIDVRIMIPRRSDSKMLQYASFSYITQCLKAGIKIYLYNPGMLHAKSMIIDDNFVTAGSTNFDFRSFENNFESNLMIYDREVNTRMREIFFEDMQKCTKVTNSSWRERPLLQRSVESVVRLVSPIL